MAPGGNTTQKHGARGKTRPGVLVPEAGACLCARVRVCIDVCLHGAQQDCRQGKPAAGHLQRKGREGRATGEPLQ